MISFDPPLSKAAPPGPFMQALHLSEGAEPVGAARWHCPSVHQGIIQILELGVNPAYRRRGHAGRLVKEVFAQARAHHRNSGARLRRAWLVVEQKEQVIARAFLSKHGFHHVATMKDMLADGDLLIYTLAFV